MVVHCDGTRRYSENSWSVMECNLTWKLQKSLHQPGTPSEAGDATQASSEGTVAATSQSVTYDTLALPDTPANTTERSDLVQSDSTLCGSEANPSPVAGLHGEISLASLDENVEVTYDTADDAYNHLCEPASDSVAHFTCPEGHQKCA